MRASEKHIKLTFAGSDFEINGDETLIEILIANLTEKGDVIVTQDYGLVALVLGKGAKALNQNVLIYTDSNIEILLFTRLIGKKAPTRLVINEPMIHLLFDVSISFNFMYAS